MDQENVSQDQSGTQAPRLYGRCGYGSSSPEETKLCSQDQPKTIEQKERPGSRSPNAVFGTEAKTARKGRFSFSIRRRQTARTDWKLQKSRPHLLSQAKGCSGKRLSKRRRWHSNPIWHL